MTFISRDNPQAAEQFGYVIIGKAESLAEFPLLGRAVPEFHNELIREVIHRPNRIVYRVKESGKSVEILRVWHAMRGIPKLRD